MEGKWDFVSAWRSEVLINAGGQCGLKELIDSGLCDQRGKGARRNGGKGWNMPGSLWMQKSFWQVENIKRFVRIRGIGGCFHGQGGEKRCANGLKGSN